MQILSDQATEVKPALPADPNYLDPDGRPFREPEPWLGLEPFGFAVDDEDEADYVEYRGRCEAREYLDRSERLTLAGVVDLQCTFFRSWNNDVGDMLADHMAELAGRIEATGAQTAAEFDARNDVLIVDSH